MDRINGVAEPDINVFNVAKPDKTRLSVFDYFVPLDSTQPEPNSVKKNTRRKRKNSARSRRNRGYYDCDEEYYDEDCYFYQPGPAPQGCHTGNPFIDFYIQNQVVNRDYNTYGPVYE